MRARRTPSIVGFAVLVCLVAGSAVVTAPTASAAALTVTSAADTINGDVAGPRALIRDPGPDGISLREAITAANNVRGPHRISFSSELAGRSIRLTGPLPPIRQDHVRIQGPTDEDGEPSLALDGSRIPRKPCCRPFLWIVASDVSISRLRFVGVQDGSQAIQILAGHTLYETNNPSAPRVVGDVRILNNVFDNSERAFMGTTDAIRVWMAPEGTASDALIENVIIAGNRFDGIGNAVLVNTSGVGNTIRGIVIRANAFADYANGIALANARGRDDRIADVWVVENTFAGRLATEGGQTSLFMGTIASVRTDGKRWKAIGSSLENVLVSRNTFTGGGLEIHGGMADDAGALAEGNVASNIELSNNVIELGSDGTGGGLRIEGGGTSLRGAGGQAIGNSVDGVRFVNNTIVTHPVAGLRVDVNGEGGSGNSVTGVSVVNTIFVGPIEGVTGPENEIAGDITPDQVSFSRTSTPGYAGVNGNIDADPLFVDEANGDLHLRVSSPAIDAGTSVDVPPLDLECLDRFDDPATPNTGVGSPPYVDMGAFEFGGAQQPCPSTGPTSRPVALALARYLVAKGEVSVVLRLATRLRNLRSVLDEPASAVGPRCATPQDRRMHHERGHPPRKLTPLVG